MNYSQLESDRQISQPPLKDKEMTGFSPAVERSLQYDARAIASYYRFRPWQTIWRAIAVIWLFGNFILHLYLDKWTNREEINQPKRATELRKIITRLGPTYIKVGQALSTRPDLIRKDFLDELTKLQDQLPPFDNRIAFRILESDLGRSIDEVYREFSPNPIAAASLGQVYKATLHTGEIVAVKVQRPNLRPKLSLDLYLMRVLAGWVEPWLPLNLGHDLTLIVDEFGTKLFEEIDYLNEARNAEKFARNFAGDPEVKVPVIYNQFSSDRVLTLEWIDGIKLTDLSKLEAAGLDPDELIKIGVTSGLRQLLEYGFFHADPHPGNLFATLDGRMAYIDFGMMDQLDESMKETIASMYEQIRKTYWVDFERLRMVKDSYDRYGFDLHFNYQRSDGSHGGFVHTFRYGHFLALSVSIHVKGQITPEIHQEIEELLLGIHLIEDPVHPEKDVEK